MNEGQIDWLYRIMAYFQGFNLRHKEGKVYLYYDQFELTNEILYSPVWLGIIK